MSDPALTSPPVTQSANSKPNTSSNTDQANSGNNQLDRDSIENRSLTIKDTRKSCEKTNSSDNIATTGHASEGRDATPSSSRTSELANLKIRLRAALRQFPDFPSPGILFEDILPIFADPSLHGALLRALEYSVEGICASVFAKSEAASTLASSAAEDRSSGSFKIDVIVGLEARGFLFGPALALRLGAAFVPVRKKGKLPGQTLSASYVKEYGEDVFEMQQDIIKPGQRVLVVDDIIATGEIYILQFYILLCIYLC